jgi:hypothetical protein
MVTKSKTPRFREWLRARRVTDTPRGDFVGDARRDPQFPDIASAEQLDLYLALRGAGREVRQIGRRLWRQYARELLS